MTTLEFNFLGGLNIRQDGRPFKAIRLQKGLALLCYLIITRKAHPRGTLAGLLWPEMPEANARMNLRKVLSQLKSHLPDCFHATRRRIGFNLNIPCRVDVAQFEAGTAVSATILQMKKAISLYRGDFLDGFYLPDALPFDEWTLAQRARLREEALQSLQALSAHFGEAGQHDEAIAYARRLLAIEPWREETHRGLMHLLAHSGQRSAALAQFDICRRMLAEELGVPPSPATLAAAEQIRRGDVSPAESLEHRAAHFSPPAVLPVMETPFVGRQTELAELDALLTAPGPRLITILGPGGIGKTRLALAAGQAQADRSRFADGVFFLDLTPLSEPVHILPTLANLLGLSQKIESGRSSQQQLLDYLRQKKMLLILDNFEHLLAGGSLLTDILRAAPGVRLLVTSRERLHRPGEQVYLLRGFPTAEDDVDETAVQLFCQSARHSRSDFAPTGAETAVIHHICRLVEGMPLGIELAAAWVDMLPLAEIAAEIEHSLDILAVDGGLHRRHQSMRAVCESTWRGLDEDEQVIFAGLSVFRGGFTRQAAEVVMGASLRQLARLQSKSLLQYRHHRDRYQVHELLRQFGAEKLINGNDPSRYPRVRDRHTAFYCAFLSERGEKLRGAEQWTAVIEIGSEIDNGRAAWGWAAEQHDLPCLEHGLNGLLHFHEWRASIQEGAATCEQALHALDNLDTVPALRLKCRLLAWLAHFWERSNRQEDGMAMVRQGLVILERLKETVADVRLEQALLWGELGTYEHAESIQARKAYLVQSLALFEELDEPWWVANARMGLGIVRWQLGVYREAEALYHQCLAEFEAMGDRLHTGHVQGLLALLVKHLGRLDEAERLQLASLAIMREFGDRFMEADNLFSLACTHHEQGRFAEGLPFIEEADRLSQELGDVRMLGTSKTAKVGLLTHLGRYQEAREELDKVRLLLPQDETGFVPQTAGVLALAEGNLAAAQDLLAQATACYRARKISRTLGITLVLQATAAILAKNLVGARAQLRDALALAVETQAVMPVWQGLAAAALLAAVENRPARAVTLFARAVQEPVIGRSRFTADVVRERIEACAAGLPPDEVERLQAQGQGLDLWETAVSLLDELGGC